MTSRVQRTIAWLTLSVFLPFQSVYALPTGQEVVSGTATFDQVGGTTLNITASADSIINYASFDIAQDEVVNFLLPTIDAFSLNRILGGGASEILGTLTSNGNLILVNAGGFYFGSAANINVGGLIASTHEIANADFLAGNYIFAGLGDTVESSMSSILNEGSILTSEGGMAIMIADAIENRGTIEAPLGTVALAAGDRVTVGITQDGMISIAVDEATAHTILDKDGNPISDQIKNTGTLTAESGSVLLTALSLGDIFKSSINLEGLADVDTVVAGQDGVIELVASGDVNLQGTLSADQGHITIDAGEEGMIDNTGTIATKLFDETAYSFHTSGTITGGDALYDNVDGAAFISGNIGSNQVDTGNLIVDGNITLTADNLSFRADSNNNTDGVFYMEAGTQIDGDAANTYNLAIVSSNSAIAEGSVAGGETPRLDTFVNMGTLTLTHGQGGGCSRLWCQWEYFRRIVNYSKFCFHL